MRKMSEAGKYLAIPDQPRFSCLLLSFPSVLLVEWSGSAGLCFLVALLILKQRELWSLLEPFLLFNLKLFDTFLGSRQFLWRCSPQFVDNKLSDLAPHSEVRGVRSLFPLDLLAFHRCIRLCSTEDVSTKLFRVHPIGDFLARRELLQRLDVVFCEATIQALVASIGKIGMVGACDHTGFVSSLREFSVIEAELCAVDEALFVF